MVVRSLGALTRIRCRNIFSVHDGLKSRFAPQRIFGDTETVLDGDSVPVVGSDIGINRTVFVEHTVALEIYAEILGFSGTVDIHIVLSAGRSVAHFQCVIRIVQVAYRSVGGLISPVVYHIVREVGSFRS